MGESILEAGDILKIQVHCFEYNDQNVIQRLLEN